ncbi:amidohydrolase family protein [Fodinicola feengrottensis]|uniref:amidohydrolase family protein n=1 Tax=Fodinicola feengrottensis TaxID=435914 RepID=UPI0013D43865|nr:amidohydrolase family protein [Fodinicola feengrottensis]
MRLPTTEKRHAAIPCVDIHNHLGKWLTGDGTWMTPDVAELIRIMDRCQVDHIVNLDGRWGTELQENLERYDLAHPGRFSTFCHVDFRVLAERGNATQTLVDQLHEAAKVGARGLKVWKNLGLEFRDQRGELVLPDDDRVAPVFDAAAELDLPVLIHTADPVAFFEPIDQHNERIEDLATNPDWWFGKPGLPTFDRLIDALEAVVAGHPRTTFIAAHVGCAAEDLRRVSRMLTAYENLHVDLGGRMPELGRQPRAARRLIVDHPRQVLFGTDLYPVVEQEYHRWFRFVETDDECFGYAPDDEIPPMGRWDISALDIPASHLAALYAGNARRILRLPVS